MFFLVTCRRGPVGYSGCRTPTRRLLSDSPEWTRVVCRPTSWILRQSARGVSAEPKLGARSQSSRPTSWTRHFTTPNAHQKAPRPGPWRHFSWARTWPARRLRPARILPASVFRRKRRWPGAAEVPTIPRRSVRSAWVRRCLLLSCVVVVGNEPDVTARGVVWLTVVSFLRHPTTRLLAALRDTPDLRFREEGTRKNQATQAPSLKNSRAIRQLY
jgi:hypothetical protein